MAQLSGKASAFWCGRYEVNIPSRSNLPHVANDSPPLQPWWSWRKAAEMGTAVHSWVVTPERVLKRI